MRAAALPFPTAARLPKPVHWALVAFWPLYALVLMLPWLGTYTLSSMLPTLGQSAHFDVSHLGSLGAGIPQLGGGLYDAIIFALWSMAYFLLRPSRAESVITHKAARAPDRLVLRDGKRAVVLAPGEIDRIEAEGDYVRVHAGTRRLLLRATMSRTEAVLPPHEYVRIHRSAIVRVARIAELLPKPNNELEVVLRDGTKLRASRTYADHLRVALGVSSRA